jgi:integrase
MPLSDVEIKKSKSREKPYKRFDGGGLYLLVNPNGSKLWRLKYRVDGREKLLAYGSYPLVPLKDARAWRDRSKRLLLDGVDPGVHRRSAKNEASIAAANTFGVIAADYLAKAEKEGKSETTLSKKRWLLGLAGGEFEKRPIEEITSPEVLAILTKVQDKGQYETARRLRSTTGGVFSHAIATARASNDPTYALRAALIRPTVTSRAAIIDPAEVGVLLRRIDQYKGQPTTRLALQLLMLFACRPGELRQAQWSEFDIEGRVWQIPETRMKMRRPHYVPLADPAVELLDQLSQLSPNPGLLFPSTKRASKPISENTLNGALRRMGYSRDEVTSHGFRTTFSTRANEAGKWNPDAIERALAHVDANKVRRVYARGEHWDERVRLSAWWAGKLDDWRRFNPPS